MSATASHIESRVPALPIIFGAVVCTVSAVATLPGWAPTLLLLAAFVVFPLGLELADEIAERRGWMSRGWVVPCALPLVFSFALDRGTVAAGLALPWLILTGCLALDGTIALWRASRWSASELGVAATRIFPVVGGLWLVLSRLGAKPLDLSDALVQATAMHFHYAGFALPLLAARVAVAFAWSVGERRRRGRLAWRAAGGGRHHLHRVQDSLPGVAGRLVPGGSLRPRGNPAVARRAASASRGASAAEDLQPDADRRNGLGRDLRPRPASQDRMDGHSLDGANPRHDQCRGFRAASLAGVAY